MNIPNEMSGRSGHKDENQTTPSSVKGCLEWEMTRGYPKNDTCENLWCFDVSSPENQNLIRNVINPRFTPWVTPRNAPCRQP
jgi:hypothetical protein